MFQQPSLDNVRSGVNLEMDSHGYMQQPVPPGLPGSSTGFGVA